MDDWFLLPAGTPDPLTPAQVGLIFRADRKAVTRWADTGRLASFRTPGGHRRFRRADVQAALREGYTPRRTDG